MKQPIHFIRYLTLLCCTFLLSVPSYSQSDLLIAKKQVIPNGYNFWLYMPENYQSSQESTPLIVFLHGASLCGNNLDRVLSYGTLDAIKRGIRIPAMVVAPQNPGGAWNPDKVNDILEWLDKNKYAYDHQRIYVIGMSLGGYGTLDFVGTYFHKVAASMALCGGCSLKDLSGLSEVPLWIIHGTADRAVSAKESQRIVNILKAAKQDQRLRHDWILGASHGDLARYLYTPKTYEWLLSHTRSDAERRVEKNIKITSGDLQNTFRKIEKRPALEIRR